MLDLYSRWQPSGETQPLTWTLRTQGSEEPLVNMHTRVLASVPPTQVEQSLSQALSVDEFWLLNKMWSCGQVRATSPHPPRHAASHCKGTLASGPGGLNIHPKPGPHSSPEQELGPVPTRSFLHQGSCCLERPSCVTPAPFSSPSPQDPLSSQHTSLSEITWLVYRLFLPQPLSATSSPVPRAVHT